MRFFVLFLVMVLAPYPIGFADEQKEAQDAANVAKNLTSHPQELKKLNDDINHSLGSYFAGDHRSVIALPPDITFYTKKFADQLGLRDEFIIPLDPAIEGIQIGFKRILKFDYDPNDPFVKKYGLDHLTPRQKQIFDQSLPLLLIIFRHHETPAPQLHEHYDCYIKLFLNNSDPRVKALQLPNKRVFWGMDQIVDKMLGPIQMYQIAPAQDPDLKQAPHNEANQLIANYYGYLQKNLNMPQAGLAATESAWMNHDSNQKTLITYNGHFINFLPGMNYIIFNVPYCRILDYSKHGIWLFIQNREKAGKGFSAFHLPAKLMKSDSLQMINEANRNIKP